MPKFSRLSISKLVTCHTDLQELCYEAIKHVDFSIICGFRGEAEQNEAYHNGYSKLEYPFSSHNSDPARAIDVIPYPVDWEDINRIYMFVGFMRGVAAIKGIKIRVGADWDGDMNIKDQNFHDLPHIELL